MGKREEIFEVIKCRYLVGSERGIGSRNAIDAEPKRIGKGISRLAGSAVALRAVVNWVVEGDPQVKTSLSVIVRVHGNAKHLVG